MVRINGSISLKHVYSSGSLLTRRNDDRDVVHFAYTQSIYDTHTGISSNVKTYLLQSQDLHPQLSPCTGSQQKDLVQYSKPH